MAKLIRRHYMLIHEAVNLNVREACTWYWHVLTGCSDIRNIYMSCQSSSVWKNWGCVTTVQVVAQLAVKIVTQVLRTSQLEQCWKTESPQLVSQQADTKLDPVYLQCLARDKNCLQFSSAFCRNRRLIVCVRRREVKYWLRSTKQTFSAVLYYCEEWHCTVRKQHILEAPGNEVLNTRSDSRGKA